MEHGTEVRVVVDTADTPPAAREPPSSGRRGRLLGWTLIVAGVIGLVAMTDPLERLDISVGEGVDTPQIEIPASVDEAPVIVQRGGLSSPALSFEKIADVPGLFLVRNVEIGLLGFIQRPDGGFDVARSDDGIGWEALPALPRGATPRDVTVYREAPVVVGTLGGYSRFAQSPFSSAERSGQPMVWRLDGADWRAHRLPTEDRTTMIPTGVVALADGIVVSGVLQSTVRDEVLEALPDELVDLLDGGGFYLEVEPDRASVYFQGNRVWDRPLEDLGVTPPASTVDDVGSVVLASGDMVSWEVADLAAHWYLGEMRLMADGSLSMTAWGETSQRILTTWDGVEWTEGEAVPGHIERLVEWKGEQLGVTTGSITRWDGRFWSPVTPADFLPRSDGQNWHFAEVEESDGQLVSALRGIDWSQEPDFEPVVLRSLEGLRVEFRPYESRLAVFDSDNEWHLRLWEGRSDVMRLDAESSTLELLDGEAVVARLDVGDLVDVDRTYYPVVEQEIRVLVTADLRRWHMGTLDDVDGAFRWPAVSSLVVDNTVRVIVFGSDEERPTASIWSSPLP